MKEEIRRLLIDKGCTIKQAMKKMTNIGQKILFVVDSNNALLGVLSDGDVRKWILAGNSLGEGIDRMYNRKPKSVKTDYRLSDVKKLMLDLLIESVPVVNDNNDLVDVLTWDRIFSENTSKPKASVSIQAVIMAGGKGTRLDPFTRILPKPLIPIGDKPIVELIMDRLAGYGINDFFISLNHKSRMIKSYFEDKNDKYALTYIEEGKPLGTAGSLRLLAGKIKSPFLITNCDIIIETDYAELIGFHKMNNLDMTLVVSCKHYVIPYGVCEIETGGALKRINEKPGYDMLVNTGMYVMDEKLLGLIPEDAEFNVDQLINKAKEAGFRIGVFPISEDSWVDIGHWEEYHKALEKLKNIN